MYNYFVGSRLPHYRCSIIHEFVNMERQKYQCNKSEKFSYFADDVRKNILYFNVMVVSLSPTNSRTYEQYNIVYTLLKNI